jgi:hypothetical protein
MVAGPASGDFAEYRLEAPDIRQAASQIDDGRQCMPRPTAPHCRALAAARN